MATASTIASASSSQYHLTDLLPALDNADFQASHKPHASINDSQASPRLAVAVSDVLHEAEIACVLWGNLLLSVYGDPSIIDCVDFVVADDLEENAIIALSTAGAKECSSISCHTLADASNSRRPSAHVHTRSGATIALHRQSEMLWRMCSLQQLVMIDEENGGIQNTLRSHKDLILARDLVSRREKGSIIVADEWQTVKLGLLTVPTAHRLAEAYIVLMLRDEGQQAEFYWLAMLAHIHEYAEQTGLLDVGSLKPPHRRFFEGYMSGERPVAELLGELRQAS